jgi:hypothetical protein
MEFIKVADESKKVLVLYSTGQILTWTFEFVCKGKGFSKSYS